MAHNRQMPVYVFLKDFGNKKAGDKCPLSPESEQFLSKKGIIEKHNTGENAEKKPSQKSEPAKRGRKKK